jgi:malate dehydrogenase (oxaloacetate-decarboxylating)
MNKKDLAKKALALHKRLGGKINTGLPMKVTSRKELSLIYTPGVAAVSSYVARHPHETRDYTIKGKMVAVISDGSAVLGLGNIGPYGALPVMEGKAALFKTFADVDAFPIVLNTQDVDEIVDAVCAIAPAFGGINLEDFAAPNCFEIEERIKARLDIPVMHDDQHGTAIAVTAALMNAAKVVRKKFESLKVVIIGAGAAGTAVARLLLKAGVKHVVILDSKGIVHHARGDLTHHKKELARATSHHHGLSGELKHALPGADAVIGVSGPNILTTEHITLMSQDPIVFGLANPTPEIMPEAARGAGAAVVATGRSDYPNQINNSLVFPGVFRGALDNRVTKITDDMKLRAAKNLAALVKRPTAEKIVPNPFEKGVAAAVAKAIR